MFRIIIAGTITATISSCTYNDPNYAQYQRDQYENGEAIRALDMEQSNAIPYEQRIRNTQQNQVIRGSQTGNIIINR